MRVLQLGPTESVGLAGLLFRPRLVRFDHLRRHRPRTVGLSDSPFGGFALSQLPRLCEEGRSHSPSSPHELLGPRSIAREGVVGKEPRGTNQFVVPDPLLEQVALPVQRCRAVFFLAFLISNAFV